ncbi:MAG: amidohydrolase family protein [Gemmataceae bacterium]
MNTFARIVVVTVALAATARAAETHVYRANRLWTGTGPAIPKAMLVVRDGKIIEMGTGDKLPLPAGATVHDLGDVTIIPGLVVAETTLAEKGRDDLMTLTPHYRAADGYDPYADYSAVLAGGVTTVQISPGKARLLPGQGSVVKLAGDATKRIVRAEESLRVMLGNGFRNAPSIYEPPVGAMSVAKPLLPTRAQPAGSLAEAVATLRATFQAARADAKADPFLKAVAEAGTAKKPLRVSAPAAADLRAALTLADEFDLKLILVEPDTIAPYRDKLSTLTKRVAGVVLNPGVRPGTVADAPADGDKSPALVAKELRAAGLRIALKPVADADLKELLYLAGLLTTQLTPEQALATITSDAAAMLGVGDRVGSLEPGKDADFVVLTGSPFELHTRVKAVYVNGTAVYETAPAAKAHVVRGTRIITGTGETLAGGAVLIEGRTIRAVGTGVSIPADAETASFPTGAYIVPGFLDLANGLGLGGPLTQAAISTKLGDRLVNGDPQVAIARQGGVTTALLSAGGTQPGPVLAFKMGETPRAVKDPVAIRFAIRGNLTTAGPQLRDQLRAAKAYHEGWAKYEAELPEYERKKKEYDAAKAKAPTPAPKADEKKPEEKKEEPKGPPEPKAPTKPQSVESLEPFRALVAGKIPALVEARREDAIKLAVAIFRDEFNLTTVLIGADDAYRLVDLLAGKNIAVAAAPPFVKTVEHAEVNLPLALAVRSVPFGFESQATTGAKQLPTAIGYAVRHGLGTDDALRGLTAGPAKFLGLESVGTLATGKDADLVVVSGAPFALSTRVLAVMVDGQWVYREKE